MRFDGSVSENFLLCLLVLRGLRTLRVRTRAFGPQMGEKLTRDLRYSKACSLGSLSENLEHGCRLSPLISITKLILLKIIS